MADQDIDKREWAHNWFNSGDQATTTTTSYHLDRRNVDENFELVKKSVVE